MPIKLNGATNGSVELNVPAAVGSDLQLTLPAVAGEVVVKATDGSVDLGSVDIDSSGRVGIGITPTAKLHLGGTNPNLVFGSSGNELTYLQRYNNDFYVFNKETSGSMLFGTANNERMRIDSSGNVGIGTSSPSAKLDVSGVIRSTGSTGKYTHLVVDSAGSYIDASHFTQFRTNGASSLVNAMRIDSSGKVGIGTSSPTEKLHVDGNVRGGRFVAASGGAASPDYTFAADDTMGMFRSPGALCFSNGDTERMRIDSSGNVGIGTSSPGFSSGSGVELQRNGTACLRIHDSTNSKAGEIYADSSGLVLDARGTGAVTTFDIDGTERMRISQQGRCSTVSTDGAANILATTLSANTSSSLIVGKHSSNGSIDNGTDCFVVRSNGNVENTNNSYSSISDVKLKENIVDANSQWDDLKAVQVRNFNFKAETGHSTHTQIGVVAQEIEAVSPGLVYETPDRDDEGEDLGTVTKAVSYSVLYMKCVKALQEAMDRIETLETKVATLEATL